MRFASRATIVAALLGLPMLLVAAVARTAEPAQGDAKVAQARETARGLALKALAKIDGGQVEEGIALLEQAEATFHAPTHLLYLAQAHASLGRAAIAAQTYDTLVREELPNYAPDEFREAERIGRIELTALESRVGRVELQLIGAPEGEPWVAKLDGAPRRVAGRVVYLEPGAHEVEVRLAGEVQKARVESVAGGLQRVMLQFGDLRPRPQVGKPGFAADTSEAAAPYVVPGAILLSLGGAAIVAGAVTGVLSLRDVDALSDRCPDQVGCDPADRDLADSARLLGNVSTAMFVIGGAAAVAGTVLVLIPAPAPTPRSAHLRSVIGPGFVGLEGSF